MSILIYIFFAYLILLLIFGKKEEELLVLIAGPTLFYINVTLNPKPELTPLQLILYIYLFKTFTKGTNHFIQKVNAFPAKLTIFLIFVTYAITTFVNHGDAHDYYEAFRYCFDKYMLLLATFLCARKCEEENFWNKFCPILLGFCFLGVIEFILNHNFIREAIANAFPSSSAIDTYGPAGITNGFGSGSWRPRISITTKHPTTLGTALVTLFLFTLPILKTDYKTLKKSKIKLVLIALFATAVLSGSRTAIVCIILGCLLYKACFMSLAKKILLFLFIAFCSIYFSANYISSFEEKESGSSLSLRQQQLLFTLVEFSNSPFFGHGLYYTNHTILAGYEDGYYNKEETQGLESIVFYSLLDIGLVGFLCILLLFFQMFLYFYKARHLAPTNALQGMLTTISLLAFLVLSGEIGRNTEISFVLIGSILGFTYKKVETAKEIPSKLEGSSEA